MPASRDLRSMTGKVAAVAACNVETACNDKEGGSRSQAHACQQEPCGH